MAAILKIIGWLAFAVGALFIIMTFIISDGLSIDTMISLAIFLMITAPLIIGLSHLIDIAEKIQANTNWFSTGGVPAVPPVQEQPEAAAVPDEPKPEALPEMEPAPVAEEMPAREAKPASERAAQRAEKRAPRPAAPELYDANKHPAAVDEWTHNGQRVMTLEDGTFATEVDGAWYRFLKLEDVEALGK